MLLIHHLLKFSGEDTKILPKLCIFAALIGKTMAEFKIGDKVNFLSTVGGGKVTKIIDSRMVMVEVEDGFEIPTLITDLVLDYRSMPAPSKQQQTVEKVQKEPGR